MGKLNVSLLRYLTQEDFRVLTAVSMLIIMFIDVCELNVRWELINQRIEQL